MRGEHSGLVERERHPSHTSALTQCAARASLHARPPPAPRPYDESDGCAPKRTVLAMFAHRRRFFLECCRAVAAHLRKWARHRRAAAGWYAYPALAPGGMGPTSRAVNRTETTISPCATPRLCQHQIRLSDPVIRSGYQIRLSAHRGGNRATRTEDGQRTATGQRQDSDRPRATPARDAPISVRLMWLLHFFRPVAVAPRLCPPPPPTPAVYTAV